MITKVHADVYTVDNVSEMAAAYFQWVDDEYSGEPSDAQIQFPEVHATCTVQFKRDLPTNTDTITVVPTP